MEEAHASRAGADGFIPLEAIGSWATSGFTLPRLVEGQTYHSSVFAALADARAAGMTQRQVEDYIRTQMRQDGFNV